MSVSFILFMLVLAEMAVAGIEIKSRAS